MAIQITTGTPQGLLDAIYAAIDNETVRTWSYDTDKDFVHETSSRQWVGKAWLRPKVQAGALRLTVVPPQGGMSVEAYAVYHGRFIEMLLAHFDKKFTDISATALASADDRVG